MNCVWEQYREELEEWVEAKREAERTLVTDGNEGKKNLRAVAREPESGTQQRDAATSMNDDGGGSEGLWGTGGFNNSDTSNEELYKDIPVGIREFMKQEKRLKEKHVREGSSSR